MAFALQGLAVVHFVSRNRAGRGFVLSLLYVMTIVLAYVFLPAFALSIWITSRAYVDGMLGRPYTWVKTSRAGTTSTIRPAAVDQAGPVRPARAASVAAPSRPRTFALTAPGTEVSER